MKNINIIVSLIVCTIIFTSCDPGYSVDYIIDNQTSGDLAIISTVTVFDTERDSSRINSDTQLIIYRDGGIGEAEWIFENQDELPFDQLILTNASGELTKTDINSIDNWEREYVKKSELVKFKLTVSDDDF